MNFGGIINTISQFTSKHRSDILIGSGIAGLVSSMILVHKGTVKAEGILWLNYIDRNEDLELTSDIHSKYTFKERVKMTWKCYIPGLVTAVPSIGMILGGQAINHKKETALITAYNLTEKAFQEYSDKTRELIGDKKEKEIKEAIDRDHVTNTKDDENNIVFTECGNTLCFDRLSGRYFKHDIERIRQIINSLNADILKDNVITLNDLYYELNLPQTDLGDIVGWDHEHLIGFEPGSQLTPSGKPAYVMSFYPLPRVL